LKGATFEPGYLDGRLGRLFVLLRRPQGRAGGPCVLMVPPFAEEMNKTRAMLARVAEGLALRGIASVLPDLYGTGDSAGEFRDGDWETWREDLERVTAWARGQGLTVNGLLAVRLGCILAADFVRGLPAGLERTVFWQPVQSGQRFLTQFLRMRVAASLMEDRRETVAALREEIRATGTLEVAGYELPARLVEQVDAKTLAAAVSPALGDLHWMEIAGSTADPLPGSTIEATRALSGSVRSLRTGVFAGEPFWSTTEIVLLPALVNETIGVLAAAQ
jgi:exosortase A-associated hydrolase 2